MSFLGERPSIADPTEGANVDEVVNGLVREKLRRKCAVVVGYCDLFALGEAGFLRFDSSNRRLRSSLFSSLLKIRNTP